MHAMIDRKEYVKQSVRIFRQFTKPRPPNEFELLMEKVRKASEPEPITAEEWAEADKELDQEEQKKELLSRKLMEVLREKAQ